MVIQVHGSIINKDTSIDSIDEYTVSVAHGDSTAVGYNASIRVFKKEEPYSFFSIPVVCPKHYLINSDTWADFLFYVIQTQPNKKLVGSGKVSRLFQEVTCRNHLGKKYFQVKHNDFVFGMLVSDLDDDTVSSHQHLKNVDSIRAFHSLLGDDVSFTAHYGRQTLHVVPFSKDHSRDKELRGKVYSIALNNPFDDAMLLLACIRGDSSIEISPSSFSTTVLNAKPFNNALRLRNIGEFYYLESWDGNLKCSINKQSALQATNAILNFIDGWECSKATRENLLLKFAELQKDYMNKSVDMQQGLLNACVDFRDVFETTTGHRIIDGRSPEKIDPVQAQVNELARAFCES